MYTVNIAICRGHTVDNLDGYKRRKGLKGPYRLSDGQVYYFDPIEDAYYDPRTDFYLTEEHINAIHDILIKKLST